jgi:hypothetical protein
MDPSFGRRGPVDALRTSGSPTSDLGAQRVQRRRVPDGRCPALQNLPVPAYQPGDRPHLFCKLPPPA